MSFLGVISYKCCQLMLNTNTDTGIHIKISFEERIRDFCRSSFYPLNFVFGIR